MKRNPIIHPQAVFPLLLVWNFQPFTSPNSLYALMVQMPAAIIQHPGNHAITVATVFTRYRDDILGQTLLVW